jgi:hypothetical protein
MEDEMIQKLKENWKEYLVYAILGLWIFAFLVIFSASARAGCDDDVGISLARGPLCLARGIAGLSCFVGYLGVWTFLGGAVAKGKGRNPVMGWIVGFTLQFMGCLGLMMLEPRRNIAGQMIGWDEYKHYTKEQREAIKPKPVPDTPQDKRRKKIIVVIVVFTILLMVFQVLKNLGKI